MRYFVTIIVVFLFSLSMYLAQENSKLKLNIKIQQSIIEQNNKAFNDIEDKKKITEQDEKDVILKITKMSIVSDLDKISHLSNREKKIIYEALIEAWEKYGVNPLRTYGILHGESSVRSHLVHKEVTLTINNKQVKTNAIGLGGVIWEWWGDQLKEQGIAEVKNDLFDPRINILATAYIYNEMYKKPKLKDATTQSESALMRYFGGSYKWYADKINSKIAKIIDQTLLN